MERAMSLARRVCQLGLWFGGALVLLAALLIGVDVVLRKFFQMSIGGADEIAGYALALGTSWGLGAALMDRAHIRIDSLYVHFPRWLRLALDLVALALFLGFFGLVALRGWDVVEQSWISSSRSHTALETPTVIPQVLLFLQAVLLLVGGEVGAATRVISTRSAAEEVEDEIRFIKERETGGGH